jgi:hypothetical protein
LRVVQPPFVLVVHLRCGRGDSVAGVGAEIWGIKRRCTILTKKSR